MSRKDCNSIDGNQNSFLCAFETNPYSAPNKAFHPCTLLQQSLQLALLKYTFEGAAPCTSQLQRHLLGSAGVLKGPSIEEEAAIGVDAGGEFCAAAPGAG
eukprot:1152185-Pelagomonas_calceolata.AAC.6